jgi:hypothetical protein
VRTDKFGMGKPRTIWALAALPGIVAGQAQSASGAKMHRNSHPTHATSKTGTQKMTQANLQSCNVKSATLTLVEEQLLTRTAITADTIGGYAKPVTITEGDPRIAKLNAMLHGLSLMDATLPQLEMRMLLRVTCADGSTRTIAGSKTDRDGHMHLNIDGKMAMTDASLRRTLESMAGEPVH